MKYEVTIKGKNGKEYTHIFFNRHELVEYLDELPSSVTYEVKNI